MSRQMADADALHYHFLLAGLDDTERTRILAHAELRDYAAGQVVLEEGETNSRLFILLAGRVEVIKLEPLSNLRLPLATINEGGVFGELSFLKSAPCSATIRAIADVKLLSIDRAVFGVQPEQNPSFGALAANVSGTNLDRLSNTSAMYVRSAADHMEALRTQNEFGKFFIIVMVTLGLGSLLNRIANDYLIDPTNDFFSWAYLLILVLPILYFVIHFRYPLRTFGVTRDRWVPSLRDGVVAGVIGVALFLGGFWLVRRQFGLAIERDPLMTIDARLLGPTTIFYFVHSYVQEFMARGVTQTSLQRFLADRNGVQTVLITSFLFGVFHLHISIGFSVIVFVASLAFGFLYLRTQNLLGVSILHWMLGLASMQVGLM